MKSISILSIILGVFFVPFFSLADSYSNCVSQAQKNAEGAAMGRGDSPEMIAQEVSDAGSQCSKSSTTNTTSTSQNYLSSILSYCPVIDGSSIYGDSGSGWVFIGSITSPYDTHSIASEYGMYGNEYNQKSIFDSFGRYGSEFSSESAFDDYAYDPPILVTPAGTYGYLTINQSKKPAISPWIALYCAQQSDSILNQ